MMTVLLRSATESAGLDFYTKTMEGFSRLSKLVKPEEIKDEEDYKFFTTHIEGVLLYVFSPTIPLDTPAEKPE